MPPRPKPVSLEPTSQNGSPMYIEDELYFFPEIYFLAKAGTFLYIQHRFVKNMKDNPPPIHRLPNLPLKTTYFDTMINHHYPKSPNQRKKKKTLEIILDLPQDMAICNEYSTSPSMLFLLPLVAFLSFFSLKTLSLNC